MVIAVISEYNPFHLGHAVQFSLIRERFGSDCVILSVMSGDYVQRGGVAVLPKYLRAEAAAANGADLILELPFPWSQSGAEYFASAAVSLICSLGIADILCFGSESGSLSELSQTADRLSSDIYVHALDQAVAASSDGGSSSIRLREKVYRELFGGGFPVTPNDILAVEYLRALKKQSGKVPMPFTYRRGDDYSATAARTAFSDGDFDLLSSLVPEKTLETAKIQKFPADLSRIGNVLLGLLRTNSFRGGQTDIAECSGGVLEKIYAAAQESADFDELIERCSLRQFTDARVRRMIVNAALGVTREQVAGKPLYTVLLAANGKGRQLLSSIRRTAEIAIVTKPADTDKLSPEAKKQAEFSRYASGIAAPAFPKPVSPADLIREKPIIIK